MKHKFTATLPLALLAIGMLGSVTSANADLNNSIYVALDAPCRVGDTSPSTIPVGGTVEWVAYGDDMTSQGGDPDGCAQPKTDMEPIGIAVNITAAANNVATTRNGNLVAYAAGATAPTTSVVNYTPGTNIANSTIVGLSQDGKFIIQSNLASVRAIADVQGYFYARPSGVAQVAIRGGDYSSPVDAMNDLTTWCGTPSVDNRCVVKIAAGVYHLDNPLIMQNWVSVAGAGMDTTVLKGNVSGALGVVNGAANTTLRDIGLDNTATHNVIVLNIIDGFNMQVEHIRILSSTQTGSIIGVNVDAVIGEGGVTFEHVRITVGGGDTFAAGFLLAGFAKTTMNDVDVSVSANSTLNVGMHYIENHVGSVVKSNIRSAGVGEVVGAGVIIIITSNALVPSPSIRESRIEGGIISVFIDPASTPRLVNNQIIGGVDSSLSAADAKKVCRDNYDEDLKDVNCK